MIVYRCKDVSLRAAVGGVAISIYPLPGRGCHEVAGEEFGQNR